ncbi:MAG: hypothetical protein SFY92_12065 [Verrucomicrobiae bacterium]|nr:hypothetical protein [Verrucomicrobiae bacterium]
MTPQPHSRAAVLWTGGKDCALALHQARRDGWTIAALVTFAPAEADFKAHPLPVLEMQARQMGLAWLRLPVSEPYDLDYEEGLRKIRDDHGIGTVFTGDIAEVDGFPNWILQRAQPAGISVRMPLWGRDRRELWDEILAAGMKVVISCVKAGTLGPDWVGREVDRSLFERLAEECRNTDIDLSGENGEFHTLIRGGTLEGQKDWELVFEDARTVREPDYTYLRIRTVRDRHPCR